MILAPIVCAQQLPRHRLECFGHSFAYVAHLYCIFERCLNSNPQNCRCKQARYQLSHPTPCLATHLPTSPPISLLSHPSPCLSHPSLCSAIHFPTLPPTPLTQSPISLFGVYVCRNCTKMYEYIITNQQDRLLM